MSASFNALVPKKRVLNGSRDDNALPPAKKQRNTFYGNTTQSGQSQVPENAQYFLCMWRKPQGKKHKTWEGDGVLVIEGNKCKLFDKDTAKSLGTSTWKGEILGSGSELSVGGKDVEIDQATTAEEYTSGRLFMSTEALACATPATAVAPLPTKAPTRGLALHSTCFKDPRKSAPASNISGIPRVPAVGLSKVPTTAASKTPAPKFDPNAEGAILMAQPDTKQMARLNPRNLPVVDVVIDPYIGKHLRPHQIQGVKFLYDSVMGLRNEGRGAILADEMGLGKTIQAITLIWTLLRQTPFFGESPVVSRVLIACPVTLVKNWAREFKKWLGQDKIRVFAANGKVDLKPFCATKVYEVLIIGYERLRLVVDDLKKAQPPFGLIVCDEGHRLKSAGTKTVQALNCLNTTRRIILSGTPVQNDLSEFHAMADWVNPGMLESYATFKKIYEAPIVKSREQNCTSKNKELGQARSAQLTRVAKSFVLRRSADILHGYLPPKHEHCVFVLPNDLQREIFLKMLNKSNIVFENYLSLMQTYQKVSNTPGLLMKKLAKGALPDDWKSWAHLLEHQIDPHAVNLSSKLSLLANMLNHLWTQTEDKVILVSNFTSTLDIFENHLKNKSYPYCRLDGSTQQAKRQEIVDQFNNGPRNKSFVFLLSSKSGGSGLNLIGANRLILYDSDWNPSVDAQAMARIHRDGQKKISYIYRFLTVGAIDEKVFQRQIIKTGLAGAITESANGKTDAFTGDEIRAIFSFDGETACQTHDLLECDCFETGSVNQEELEEDLDEHGRSRRNASFVKATDYQAINTFDRKRLTALKDWAHVHALRESCLDEITDDVLRTLVADGLSKMEMKRRQQLHTEAREEDESDGDEEADRDSESNGSHETVTIRQAGGSISFILSKVSGGIQDA